MKSSYDNNVPIYIQIMEEMKIMIVSNHMKAGDKVASVRDLAQSFGVNPNTMQRALAELERENLLYSERTSGRFITTDEGLIMNLREEMAQDEMKRFLEYMKKIGYDLHDIIEKMKEVEKGE
jgi:GntR family transcriptional regulator